ARPPAIVRWFEACLGRVPAPAGKEALRVLLADRALRLWHVAQLPGAQAGGDTIDVDHVVAIAKVERSHGNVDRLCEWLSNQQTLALLNDPDYLLATDGGVGPGRVAAQNR